MTPPRTLKKLTELFSLVGAKKPESWARSQLEEGIPQLHRFLFLRQAWARVVAEDDREWIDSARHWAKQDPDGPGAGVGHSLERLLKAGASPDDLTELVRGMQWRLLFDLCYMLEDPAFVEDELDGFGWALVATDAHGEPTDEVIGGLHDSVLEMDPDGREMRPKRGP